MADLNQMVLLAQVDVDGGVGGLLCMALWLVMIVVMIVANIAGFWKVFEKAGKPGWGAIIPIYNAILFIQIAGRPIWWFVLLFIPLVNVVVCVIVGLDIARRFGKDTLFAIGLILLPFVFYPILGFGDAKYQ
jgi:hypothetical protein